MDGSAKPDNAPAPGGKGLARSPGALAGLKVIDLTRVLGGPYCTMILSDHGAEVIKVEPPQGDEVRDWGPPFSEGPTASRTPATSSASTATSSPWRSISAIPRARPCCCGCSKAPTWSSRTSSPGAMEKWGLGYEEVLSKRFPGLIHCRISGFGADGPLGGLPGYDAILQAMVGLMSVNGDPTTGPMRLGTAMVDMGTGLYSAVGILMALQERGRIGPRPVSGHDALRLRHVAAAPAGAELLPQRQAARCRPAIRIPTWCRTTSTRRRPARSSSPAAITGNSESFAS